MNSPKHSSTTKRQVQVVPLVPATRQGVPDIYLVHGTWADGMLSLA